MKVVYGALCVLTFAACGSKYEEEKEVCEQAIVCLAEATGGADNVFQSTYGPDGTCWTQSSAQASVCAAACQDTLDLYDTVEACGGDPANDTDNVDTDDGGGTDGTDDTDG